MNTMRNSRVRIVVVAAVVGAGVSACTNVKRFVGADIAPHTSVCLVVAPDLIASDDLAAALERVVHGVASDRGTIDGYVASTSVGAKQTNAIEKQRNSK
jgi:hypothetical protein